MESHQENWWRGLRRDLRRNRPRDQGTGRTQAGVCQTAEAGSEDGGGRSEETTRYHTGTGSLLTLLSSQIFYKYGKLS